LNNAQWSHGTSLALPPVVRRIVLLLILSNLLACGCAATQLSAANSSVSIAPWVRRYGGLVTGPEHQRLQHALSTVSAVLGPETQLRASVLNSSKPAAYAWPDGSLFVTRGLKDQLDDAE
jgi:predicted Zn-dependent protease